MAPPEVIFWTVALIATLASLGLLRSVAMFMKHHDDVARLHRRVHELKTAYAQRNKERLENGEDLLSTIEVVEAPSKAA
jgi:hypothetical protein